MSSSRERIAEPPPVDVARQAALQSPWAPFRHGAFRSLWTGALAMNLATLMQIAGAAWLMVSLTASPLFVGLIQTASALPVFLLALPGGVLADLVNRRRLLLVTQSWMLASAVLATGLTYFGAIEPWSLLLVTAALGMGFAFQTPAWHTSQAEAVPRTHLPAALALSAIAFNVARAVGPAIAGLIVAVSGVHAVFALCALGFLAALAAIVSWRGTSTVSALPAESLYAGLRGALRYVRHSSVMRVQLLRTIFFIGAGSSLWVLIPVVAREELGLGATGYGLLLGTLGAGAIAGAFLLPFLRGRLGLNGAANGATAVYALAVLVTSYTDRRGIVVAALLAAGVAWMIVGNTNLSAMQTSIPAWVRARAMAVYMLAFQGAMALGGVVWGAIGSGLGIAPALVLSAATLMLALIVMRRYPARIGKEAEVTPSEATDVPTLVGETEHEEGPVAVQVQYRIRPAARAEFVRAIHAVGRARRRDGATSWRLYRDLADPTCYVERFLVDSWADYLRQRARATVADRQAEELVVTLHVGEQPPVMQHFIAEAESRRLR